MENINLTLTDIDLNKNLTPDDIDLDASTLSHLRSILQARRILDRVWERYSKNLCIKLNNESTKTITIVNRSYKTIDEAKVLEKLGADGLAEVKTKVIDQHYVSNL